MNDCAIILGFFLTLSEPRLGLFLRPEVTVSEREQKCHVECYTPTDCHADCHSHDDHEDMKRLRY